MLIFLRAHVVEALLFLRYYFLLPFFAIARKRPSLSPEWMGKLIYIQPATLEYLQDVVIDDSRARKMIGFVLLTQQKLVRCIDRQREQLQTSMGDGPNDEIHSRPTRIW